jgi:hypothetical protein
MIQTAVVSGEFSGQLLGRKRRPAREEDLYASELVASNELDLLDPNSRRVPQMQRPPSTSWQRRLFFEIQKTTEVSSVAAPTLQADVGLRQDQPSESVGELLRNLQKVQRTPTLPELVRHPAFLRLVPKSLGDASKIVIGEHGLRRYEEFRRYHSGWDFGRGAPLSQRSVAAFESFVSQLPDLVRWEPSLFLTHQGNLQLGWENSDGSAAELEFFPDKIEYYLESLSEEGSVDLSSQQELIEKIRLTL